MKAIKIGLAVLVLAIIATFLLREIGRTNKPDKVSISRNQFSERIRHEIDSLSKLPDSKFCRDYYDEVSYHITSDFNDSRLGNNQLENDQERDILIQDLYTHYSEKFIKQAFFVFNRSGWDLKDLQFIRREYQKLRKSQLLEQNSTVDQRLIEIHHILSKYDEIAGFIASCRNFSYYSSDLSGEFPVSDIKVKIFNAANYRNNQMQNPFVNKCSRLHTGLNEVPNYLFKSHVAYLDNTIDMYYALYSNYNSQSAYADALYKPVESKIKRLENEIYHVSGFDYEYKRLAKKWEADAIEAYRYFSKKHQNQ